MAVIHLHRPQRHHEATPPAPAVDAARAATVIDIFRDNVAAYDQRPALRRSADGKTWSAITWADYGRAVERAAAGLVEVGVEPGDRVAILSGNRVEWQVADLAIQSVRAVAVPIYATSAGRQVRYQLEHSGSKVCFVEDAHQLAKVLLHRGELAALERVVVFDTTDGLDDRTIVAFDVLQSLGDQRLATEPDCVEARVRSATENDIATIVYTSGTTGPPKGTVITHANVMGALRSVTAVVPLSPDDRFLSFLPLSHIAERTISHFGQIASGGETWFARSLATVPDDLQACRPTIFFAVPRVWEKFREAIVATFESKPAPLRAAFDRYLRLGLQVVNGETLERGDQLAHTALDRSIGALLRHKVGLDHARILVSGAAPIHPDLLRWFHAIGLPVAEGYGQTENMAVATLNPAHRIKIGTVGVPFPRVELRIAPDGEILTGGETTCAGYYRNEAATAELIDPDGWMHTGDLGQVDDDGYVTITGRKKDLIITSSGKNIGPEQIETDLRQIPLISQAVVVGDSRSYLVALLTLDAEAVAAWAAKQGKLVTTIEALRDDPDLAAELAAGVAAVNATHARIEQIKRWRVLPGEFTVASGELTPTLKVKRAIVTERNAALIEELYAG